MSSLRRSIAHLFGAFTIVAGCNDDPERVIPPTQPPPPAPAPVPVPVSLQIYPGSLDLLVGEAGTLSYMALDANNRYVTAAVQWTSRDPSIATIGRTDGRVSAIAAGTTTMTATIGALSAFATVTVSIPQPTVLRLSASELTLSVGMSERLTAQVSDQRGRLMNAMIAWSSQNATIASVNAEGTVTGTGVGNTTIVALSGAARAELPVRVEPANFLIQWANSASASSQYEPVNWSTDQAIGTPNVTNCNDESKAWAALSPTTVEWIELTYATPVVPTEIRIHEVYAPGSIVKVEVRNAMGAYRQVYTATPLRVGTCLRVLTIAVTGVTEPVSAVRVTIDQSVIQDWNEIDAVRLSGLRQP